MLEYGEETDAPTITISDAVEKNSMFADDFSVTSGDVSSKHTRESSR